MIKKTLGQTCIQYSSARERGPLSFLATWPAGGCRPAAVPEVIVTEM